VAGLSDLQAVFLPEPALPACGRIGLYRVDGVPPSDRQLDAVGAGGWEQATALLALPGPDGPPGLAKVPLAAAHLGVALPVLLSAREAADSLRGWAAAARAALALVAARRLLPALERPRVGDPIVGRWRVAGGDGGDALLDRIAGALPVAGFALALDGRDDDAVWRPEALVRAFADAVADLAVRSAPVARPRPGRPRARLLPWTARWAEALADPTDATVPLRGDDADDLLAGIASWSGGDARVEPAGTAELTLTAPARADAPWRLALGVRTDDGAAHPAREVWAAPQEPGGRGATRRGEATGAEPGALQQTLLRGLVRAAQVFAPLDTLLDQAAPEGVDLSVEEAWRFLDQAADRLLSDGIGVVLPQELTATDLAVRVRVGAPDDAPDPSSPPAGDRRPGPGQGESGDDDPEGDPDGEEEPDLDALHRRALAELAGVVPGGGERGALGGLLTGFRWEVALGGQTLSAEEFAEIVAAKAPLVRFRERWVRVDPARLGQLERLGPAGALPLAEALALGLAGSERVSSELFGGPGGDDAETVDVVVDGGLADLVERIREAGERPPAPATPSGFTGELRPYQRRGVAWLKGMGDLGLGAVLADDMGLGKGVQLACYLLLLGERAGPHLVICPTSVVGNWQRELARFAPDLPVTRHHGAGRAADLSGVQGVVLTSYGTLRRDVDLLAGVDWDVVALDEAQQVKNPSTAGARAVRRLRSRQTVALTGTPLENRLSELWSLLDATNPGLLGTRARFARHFVAPIEQRRDAEAARRLRRLVAPFLLRRSKQDPTVIADLPDKVERTLVCALTPEQAALYQAAVDRVLGQGLATASDMERRGRILALLTELKQICNHPGQYLRESGAGRAALLGRSGKLEAARDLVAEAVGGDAQVLVFTQYVEMGRLLAEVLGGDLGRRVPFLHGSVPAAQRDRIVAAFQGEPDAVRELGQDSPPPVLLVSLRAGGTGLNLTAATHVVHYDRWWNPAVEDQATDRAHRIGQSSTVYVHKLVTAGTVEERVAELLDRKRELAEQVVGTGESWITELGDRELGELVALSGEAVADVEEWSAA
jgi:superfamily II DNA or RNA helicase